MPILNLTLQSEARGPDGQKIVVPSHTVLAARGPIVEITISLAESMARPILQSGGRIPAPITGLGLIDTGASLTCIDDETAFRLGLPVTGTARISSASEEASLRKTYPVQIDFVGWGVKLATNRAVGANLGSQGLVALIGRDMLQRCLFVYNGPPGSFSLAL